MNQNKRKTTKILVHWNIKWRVANHSNNKNDDYEK